MVLEQVTPRRRPRRARPLRTPDTLAADYVRAWRKRNAEVRRVLLERLPLVWAILEATPRPGPSAPGRAQRTDSAAEDVEAEIEEIQRLSGLGPLFANAAAEALVARLAVEVSGFHAREFRRASRYALGVDVLRDGAWLAEHLDAFVRENVNRWHRYPATELEDMGRLILRRWREGVRPKDIATEMAAKWAQYERSAEWLARDQVLKLFGEVHDVRMAGSGIGHAWWSTSRDELVRPTHRALEGKRYDVGIGARVGDRHIKPGQERACRCVGIPDFSEALNPSQGPQVRGDQADTPGLRVVITGGPRTGKTTLSACWPGAEHTDDLIGQLEWSEASDRVALDFDRAGPWCIEGVAAVRALRKWLRRNVEGKPCDLVLWCEGAKVERTPGQESMATACETIWDEIRNELEARGVRVVEVR